MHGRDAARARNTRHQARRLLGFLGADLLAETLEPRARHRGGVVRGGRDADARAAAAAAAARFASGRFGDVDAPAVVHQAGHQKRTRVLAGHVLPPKPHECPVAAHLERAREPRHELVHRGVALRAHQNAAAA